VETVLNLIQEYESLFYLITFAWTYVEGETFVIFAGYACHEGYLNIYWLIGAAWIGSFCGDQTWFFLGRKFGRQLVERFPKWRAGIDTAMLLAEKYNTAFILSFRFIYGVRNFSSIALGMSNVTWTRFFILNFIAAGMWANIFAWSGYLLGQAFEAVLGDIAKGFGLVMLTGFAVMVWLAVRYHKRQKLRKPVEVETVYPATEKVPEREGVQ